MRSRETTPARGYPAPLLTAQTRARRRRKAGSRWHADETYVKVRGGWCYLYRAIDADGNLVDSMLGEHRDMDAARRFSVQAIDVVAHRTGRVTTGGHASHPRAILEMAGERLELRCNQSPSNRLEQDHRGIEERYRPMRGFGSLVSASRFCRAFDDVRDHSRTRRMMGEAVSLAGQRRRYAERLAELGTLPAA